MKQLIFFILMGFPFLAFSAAEVSVGTTDAEGVRWIEFRVDDIAPVYGMQVELSYNKKELRVVDALSISGTQIHRGGFFSEGAYEIANTVDEFNGSVRYSVSLLKPAEQISGSGSLFKVGFETLIDKVSTIDLGIMKFGNKSGEQVPANFPYKVAVAPALSRRSTNITDEAAYQFDAAYKPSAVTGSGQVATEVGFDPVLISLLVTLIALLLVIIFLLLRQQKVSLK